MTIRTRVRNGIKWLNKRTPNWRSKINQAELDMSDCTRCILGQVYGSYFAVIRGVHGKALPEGVAVRLGFQKPTTKEYNPYYYAQLAQAWRSELRVR